MGYGITGHLFQRRHVELVACPPYISSSSTSTPEIVEDRFIYSVLTFGEIQKLVVLFVSEMMVCGSEVKRRR